MHTFQFHPVLTALNYCEQLIGLQAHLPSHSLEQCHLIASRDLLEAITAKILRDNCWNLRRKHKLWQGIHDLQTEAGLVASWKRRPFSGCKRRSHCITEIYALHHRDTCQSGIAAGLRTTSKGALHKASPQRCGPNALNGHMSTQHLLKGRCTHYITLGRCTDYIATEMQVLRTWSRRGGPLAWSHSLKCSPHPYMGSLSRCWAPHSTVEM